MSSSRPASEAEEEAARRREAELGVEAVEVRVAARVDPDALGGERRRGRPASSSASTAEATWRAILIAGAGFSGPSASSASSRRPGGASATATAWPSSVRVS